MAETTSRLSVIKKTYHQLLYHLTCSFEEVLLNGTSQMCVIFMLSNAV